MRTLGTLNIIVGGINMYIAGEYHARHHSMASPFIWGILALCFGVLILFFPNH